MPVGDHTAPPATTGVRHPRTLVLRRGRRASAALLRQWYDVRTHHPERLPSEGPVVVAGNHVGFVDGPLMGFGLPRSVHAWTKVEMFTGPLGVFLTAVGQIPLDRFRVDPSAVRTALRVLRDGNAVGVFPEGARGDGELRRFHRGAAYLAMVTGAPVVPVTFLGTRVPGGGIDSLPPRGDRIDIVIGNRFDVDPVEWPRKGAEVEAVSLRLRDHMRAGLEAALAETGRTLPGPLPPGDVEPDGGDDVMEEQR